MYRISFRPIPLIATTYRPAHVMHKGPCRPSGLYGVPLYMYILYLYILVYILFKGIIDYIYRFIHA